MVKSRNKLFIIFLSIATVLVFCFLCIGFAQLQDLLGIEGEVSVTAKETVLSKSKLRAALKNTTDVTKIYVGNFDDLKTTQNLTADDLTFKGDVSDESLGFGNSIGLYTLANIGYVLALENSTLILPADASYLFAGYQNQTDDVAGIEDQVDCLKNKVTAFEFHSVDFKNVSMSNPSSMFRMFFHCEVLDSISLPAAVTSVSQGMFRGCYKLKSIDFQGTITSIANVAFGDCYALKSMMIPDSVTSIGEGAFIWCSTLEDVTLPPQITEIKKDTFMGCYLLKNVTIPNGVTSIGDNAFKSCYADAFNTLTIPDSVTSIGNNAFDTCSNLTSLTIGNGVKSIGENAFYNCWKLPSVTISNSVESVGGGAFSHCGAVTSLTIGTSVQTIGNSAFEGIWQISSVVIPASVQTIGNTAFKGCGSLTSVTFNDGLTQIGSLAFDGATKLTRITIPDSVTSVESNAFNACPIKTATVPAPAAPAVASTSEGKWALEEVTVTRGEIPVDAFNGCYNLANVTIDGVTSIGARAFQGCVALREIVIPASVTNVAAEAFKGCYNLAKVTIADNVADIASVAETAFIGCIIANATIPAHAAAAVKAMAGYLTEVNVTSGALAENAFGGCWKLAKVTIADSVSVPADAFSGCVVANATIPAHAAAAVAAAAYLTEVNVTSGALAAEAFKGCYNLAKVTIADSVSVPADAFSGCVVANATIPAHAAAAVAAAAYLTEVNVTSGAIPAEAFNGCYNLAKVTIADGVTSIGARAFKGCGALREIVIPATVKTLAEEAFYNCWTLAIVTINADITSIGAKAFYGCGAISEITIPATVTTFGEEAFYGCIAAGGKIIFLGTQAQWDAIVKGTEWNNTSFTPTIECRG